MKTIISNSSKDTHYQAQFKRIEAYLSENTASRYMAAINTGVPIQNVCRFVCEMFKRGLIAVICKDRCAITGMVVEYLSTNPEKISKNNQL